MHDKHNAYLKALILKTFWLDNFPQSIKKTIIPTLSEIYDGLVFKDLDELQRNCQPFSVIKPNLCEEFGKPVRVDSYKSPGCFFYPGVPVHYTCAVFVHFESGFYHLHLSVFGIGECHF